MTLPQGVTGLSAVCNCSMSWSYSLFLMYIYTNAGYMYMNQVYLNKLQANLHYF